MTTLIIGLVIMFLAYLIAILNVATAPSRDTSIKSMVGFHLFSMAGMSFGSILVIIGIVNIIIDLVKGS